MIVRSYQCDEEDCAVVFTVSSEDEKYMSCCPVCQCGFTEIKIARQPSYFGSPPELQLADIDSEKVRIAYEDLKKRGFF